MARVIPPSSSHQPASSVLPGKKRDREVTKLETGRGGPPPTESNSTHERDGCDHVYVETSVQNFSDGTREYCRRCLQPKPKKQIFHVPGEAPPEPEK